MKYKINICSKILIPLTAGDKNEHNYFLALKRRFTYVPVAFSASFLPVLCFAFSFEMFGSIQDESKIHTHAVTTNKEAFTEKQ